MSHHLLIFDKIGEPVGHLRVTNEGVVLSVWIYARGFTGLFFPDAAQQTLVVVPLREPDDDEMDGVDEG